MISLIVLLSTLATPQVVDRQAPPRPAVNPRPHTFGIGPSAGGSNFGGGASVRWWFSRHLGVDTGVSFQRGNASVGGTRASTFQALPSIIYLFKDQNPNVDIDVRPYVGAGLNYSKAFRSGVLVPLGGENTRSSGLGSQVLGGIEMSFKEIDFMTISGELAYVWLPVRFTSSQAFDGLNYEFSFHFYFK